MRRLRQRKKEEAGVAAANKPKNTRSAAEKAKKLREYKTRKQREYREKFSGSKKRAIRAKDARYRAGKREEEKDEASRIKERKEKQAKRIRIPVDEKIDNLIEAATPETKRKLQRRSIYPCRARNSLVQAFRMVTKSHKAAVVASLRGNRPTNKAVVAKTIGLRRGTLSYVAKGRKNVNRKLWSDDQKLIEEFYLSPEVSCAMPNKRRSGKEGMPYHVMQCSLQSAYHAFKSKNPNVNVGICTFIRAKPVNVHLLRRMKWLQCVCDICANIKHLLTSVRSSFIASNLPIPGWLHQTPVECGLETICNGEERYSAKCLERKCSSCGVKVLIDDLAEWGKDNPSDILKWKEWAKAEETINDRQVS